MIEVKEYWGDDNFIKEVAASTRGKTNLKAGLKYLWRKGHTSPFEFAGVTIKVEAPIFTVRQWQRHRTLSYNELSLRTVTLGDYSEDMFWFSENLAVKHLYEVSYRKSIEVYSNLLRKGVKPEEARAVLPMGLLTTLYISGNLRNWLHFLSLRTHPSAQEDIRCYAQELEKRIEELFPGVMEAWHSYQSEDTE